MLRVSAHPDTTQEGIPGRIGRRGERQNRSDDINHETGRGRKRKGVDGARRVRELQHHLPLTPVSGQMDLVETQDRGRSGLGKRGSRSNPQDCDKAEDPGLPPRGRAAHRENNLGRALAQ